MSNARKYTKGHFKKAETEGKSVVIEGFANKAVTDRGNERIPPEAWDLDNYAKNPIIFFNHDRNIPIGKAIEFKVTDEGLKIKARISRSNEAPIPMIRDLIEEGILSTFSVGFDDHNTARKSQDGEVLFDRAELLETSVVTIPMNQESTFTVSSTKSGAGLVYRMKQAKAPTMEEIKTMSYEKMKEEALLQKGAWLAAVIHNAIYQAQKAGESKDKLLDKIILEGDLDPAFVKDILAGEVTPAPEAFIDAVANVMGIDRESLMKINQGDAELEKAPAPEGDAPEQEPADDEADDSEETDDEEMAMDDEEPKEDELDPQEKDFQDCVAGKIPKFIEEGMERDQAIAASINFCKEDKGCSIELTEKHYLKFMTIADGVGNEKAEEPKEEEETEEKQADQGAANGVTTSVTAKEDPTDIGQPGLELQKAQIAMMGETVNLLKALLASQEKLSDLIADKFGASTPPEATEPPAEEEMAMDEPEDEEEKAAEVYPEDEEEDKAERAKHSRLVKIQKDMEEIETLNKRLNELLMYDVPEDEDDED